MFQSNEYGWSDLTIAVNGRAVMAALGWRFSEEIESELIYGKGSEAISINDGNIKNEGELTVHQSELDKLLAATGNLGVKGLKNLTITAALVKEGRITTRKLVSCRITKLEEQYKQNDKFAEVTLPFIFLKAIY